MRLVKSIIVFNSATAGDFLTALCWSQLLDSCLLFEQQASGRVTIKNTYFKTITQQFYYNPSTTPEFDYDKIFPVENSHYWLDCYAHMADRCVFINYPSRVQQGILEIYLEKVFDNNIQKMLNLNLPNQHPYVASKMNVDNVQKIINIHWRKNVAAWQSNKNLTAIELEDFFDRSRLIDIVETLIGQPISCMDKFDSIYHNWLANNSKLRSLFTTA